MFSTLSRPYKECSAEETVRKIQDILKTYGVCPEVVTIANPFPEVYSCIVAHAPSKGGFSTNGKGRTKEYCLASAYAEFVERLQNGVYALFSRTIEAKLYDEFGFYYDPREKFLTLQEFRALPDVITKDLIHFTGAAREDFVRAYFDRIAFHKGPGLLAVPFRCSRSQKDVYLPLNLLLLTLGTNGMAGGNTYDEACYQALCELMERWAAARVYFDRLTPPTVPAEYLKKFEAECNIIDSIQKSGKYRVTIKDFSAGIGLPAVGIILHNVPEGTYRLNIGCDTSFQVALSRCLTEVFQGFKNEEVLDEGLLKIPTEEPPHFRNNDAANLQGRFEVFCKFTQNGSGVFPPSLFGAEPSYAFNPSAYSTKASYREEVAKHIEFFHSLGHTVYIRDVSYLGFPSVFVYIPEVSSLGKKNITATQPILTYDLIEMDKIESIIYRIKDLSSDELVSMTTALRDMPALCPMSYLVNLKLEADSFAAKINVSFLLGLLWLKQGNLDAAADAFLVFQLSCPDEPAYYQAIWKYLKLRASGKSAAETRRDLETELGQTAEVQQACDDMDNPDEYFKQIHLPECPNCPKCPLKTVCQTKNLVEVSRALYPVMKKTWSGQVES